MLHSFLLIALAVFLLCPQAEAAKAIAQPPGVPTLYVDESPEDLHQREEDAARPVPLPPKFVQITAIFKRALTEQLVSPKLKKELLKLSGVVERALELGMLDAAAEAIKEPTLPVELEPYRQEMLEVLKQP